MKILAVEDSRECQRLIQLALGKRYKITFCETASEAINASKKFIPTLILIDINLPDRSGFELCQEFHSQTNTQNVPIIFLTGEKDTSSVVMGLSLGADDYVIKPFNPIELLARVDSKINKVRLQKMVSEEIVYGPLRLDLARQKVFIKNTSIEITPVEFRMIRKFLSSPGQVFTRQHLIDSVFGDTHFIVDRGVDKYISSIRKKIEPLQYSIVTVPGVGYEFNPGGLHEHRN